MKRSAKLNTTKVLEIRAKYKTKTANQQQLAEHYGVCQATIHKIITGITWKDA